MIYDGREVISSFVFLYTSAYIIVVFNFFHHVGLNSIYLVMNIHICRYNQCHLRQDLAVSIKLILKPFHYCVLVLLIYC